jgi:hypothetical protein
MDEYLHFTFRQILGEIAQVMYLDREVMWALKLNETRSYTCARE